MNIVEALFYIIGFFVIYGGVAFIAFVADKLLRRMFGRGIFPKGYFE